MPYAPPSAHKKNPLWARLSRARYDETRGSAAERGYDNSWLRVRRQQLTDYPLCEDCLREGRFVPANEVHHKAKVAQNPSRRDDPTNMMSLCKSCHSKRTARGE